MKQEYCFKFDNSKNGIDKFRKYIKNNKCKYVTVDLSCLNIFDALKTAALSSAYHFQEYPSGKIFYKNTSSDIKNLISEFSCC